MTCTSNYFDDGDHFDHCDATKQINLLTTRQICDICREIIEKKKVKTTLKKVYECMCHGCMHWIPFKIQHQQQQQKNYWYLTFEQRGMANVKFVCVYFFCLFLRFLFCTNEVHISFGFRLFWKCHPFSHLQSSCRTNRIFQFSIFEIKMSHIDFLSSFPSISFYIFFVIHKENCRLSSCRIIS